MSKITEILNKKHDRVNIYIDNKFCVSVRKRTWIGMKLGVGSYISCCDLKILENNFWKKLYGHESWKREKVRINRVVKWFDKYIPEVKVTAIGLGADTNEYLQDVHSKYKGEPDLSIQLHNSDIEIIALEVSGTEKMKGKDYWIRRDKVDYIQQQLHRDVWIVLHYQIPQEKFVWIKIINSKSYVSKIINVKGGDEYYVILKEDAEEIWKSIDFKNYILSMIPIAFKREAE